MPSIDAGGRGETRITVHLGMLSFHDIFSCQLALKLEKISFCRAGTWRCYSLPGATNNIFLFYLIWRKERLVNQTERNYCYRDSLLHIFIEKRTLGKS